MSLTPGTSASSACCHHCGLPLTPGAGAGQTRFCCFGCWIADSLARPTEARSDSAPEHSAQFGPSPLLLRLGIGIFLSLNIMATSWLSYSREVFATTGAGADALTSLFAYLSLFLTTGVIAAVGLPLLPRASFLRTGNWGGGQAQALILLGALSAYALSAANTLRGSGPLYFDTCALILVAVTLGGYLEAAAKRRATTAANSLLGILPDRITVRRGGATREISTDQVLVEDVVRVLPGDTVAVDGRIEEGRSRIDESSLTGESQARHAEEGDLLLAGSLCLDGQLWLRAQGVKERTVLAEMERSLAKARADRPQIQRVADRVAALFLPSVALLALGVFAHGALRGQGAEGLLHALSVLLISCPCALGLAAPLASWQGLRRAAESGILIDSAATLERVAGIDYLVFDKTGTLSQTPPDLVLHGTSPDLTGEQALGLAASLESASRHPIAKGLLRLARDEGLTLAVPRAARAVPGRGVEGVIDGRIYCFGSRRWVMESGLAGSPLRNQDEDDRSSVFLFSTDPKFSFHPVLAHFELREVPRPEAGIAIAELRTLGLGLGIASGDRLGPTRRLARELDIEAQGELLPADKVERLRRVREQGRRVAMVGDGLNDAPVLAAADLGIAMGSATNLAQRAGHVRLLDDRLDRIPRLFRIARDVRRRIRLNLAFAFAFNGVGLLFAVVGLLSPVLAALAMVLSSLSVVRISSGAGKLRQASSSTRATTFRGTET